MLSFKSEPQSPSVAGPNSSSGLYSLDGRAGGPSGVEQPCEATLPRYLYYRLYTKGGDLKSNNPIYSNDPFTSRILPKSLTPPQTVLSLKNHLGKIEGFSGSSAILFDSLSSNAALEELTLLKLWGHLGVSSREPVVLVIPRMKRRPGVPVGPYAPNELIENPNPMETRYIYYRVYDEEGEVISKAPFDESDTFLGRIDTLSVPPPRIVASLKARIMKVEGIAYPDVQLFENTDAEALMKDADHTPFFVETFPGCVEDDPLAVVCGRKTPRSTSTMTQSIRAKCEFSE
ncbi:hypothetical protein K443DRAFT_106943 [Laccaria amethystina LaAM-08-1]|uniref:Uncharacterized protein n=1 Tax=Laccaria amethystina LaAM-08-1 TaxID=1095629 RepID=A0A0C9X5Q3_9AGAR|nr:hypothetical protein K443DRAFT_106943 [Laccaria amethystina LaAM-08-1]